MERQTGDLHLALVLEGEPSVVRSAFNEQFVPYGERASIEYHRPLKLVRHPVYDWGRGTFDLGSLTRSSKTAAESALSRICDKMEPGDIAYAGRLIDEVHRGIANRNPIQSFGSHVRFWLRLELGGDANKLLAALRRTLRIATFFDYEPSMYVREGRPPRAELRNFLALRTVRTVSAEHWQAADRLVDDLAVIAKEARRAREMVVKVRAGAVLGDMADDWLTNGPAMRFTEWHSFSGKNGFWRDLVELDFLEANLEEYRALLLKAAEEEARREARLRAEWTLPPLILDPDDATKE